MRLLHGTSRVALVLLGTRRYYPEQLIQWMLNQRKPYFLEVDGERISVDPDRELWVACQAVAAEHNACAGRYAPVDDGFEQEMLGLEERARAHMEDPAESEDSQDSAVHSEDDMVYEREVYM